MKGTDLKIKAMLSGIVEPLETTPQLYRNSVGVNELYVYSDIPYSEDIYIFAFFEKGTYNTKELLLSPQVSDKENLNLWKTKIPRPVVGNDGTWKLSIEARQKVTYIVEEDGSSVQKDGYKRLASGIVNFTVFNSAVLGTIYPEDAIYTPEKDTQYENVLEIINEVALSVNQNTNDIEQLEEAVGDINEAVGDINEALETKQRRLCAGNGINISQGVECDTISSMPPIEHAGGLKVIPIHLDDWISGEIIITASQHGFGETQNLFIQTQPLDEGVTYDSPQPEPNGDIVLRADVEWEGNLLIGGGFAVSVDRIEKTGTVGLLDTYTIYLTDGAYYDFTVTNGQKGEKGEQGNPQTIDFADMPAISNQNLLIDYSNLDIGAFGKSFYEPIIIDSETLPVDVFFLNTSSMPENSIRSFRLYIKRLHDVAVIWPLFMKFEYNEPPLLPVGKTQIVYVEVYDEHLFGIGGGYVD